MSSKVDQSKVKEAEQAMLKRSKPKQKGFTKTQYTVAIAVVGGATALGVFAALFSPKKGIWETPVNDESLISHVNVQSRDFKAAASAFFENWSLGDVKRMGGTGVSKGANRLPSCAVGGDTYVPSYFDAREKWPDCFETPVYESGNCTDAWAITTASALSNRFCIADPAKYKDTRLSPQSLLSCDKTDRGCEGGDLDSAWTFAQTDGLVSEKCFPFKGTDEVGCDDKCSDETPLKAASVCVLGSEEAIMRELVVNGPVVAPMFLFDDFLVYKSGVYNRLPTAKQVTDSKRNYVLHPVKIIGWGMENKRPHWLVENSWGADWGQEGFAKVLRGASQGSVVIDTFGITGSPQVKAPEAEPVVVDDKKADKEEDFEDIDLDDADLLKEDD